MAKVVIFEPDKTPVLLSSVNTPEYVDNPNAIINPDLTAVEGVSLKYWKREGDAVVEMTQAEKDAVIASELAERKAIAEDYRVDLKTALTALVKVINLRLPSNKITKAEMIQALKDEIF